MTITHITPREQALQRENSDLIGTIELMEAKIHGLTSNIDAAIAFCPTCSQGVTASPDMTRDEVIFYSGRAARSQECNILKDKLSATMRENERLTDQVKRQSATIHVQAVAIQSMTEEIEGWKADQRENIAVTFKQQEEIERLKAQPVQPASFTLAEYPEKCPITRRPFFMVIEHPDLGMVPTYGGPFDSYTIPHMLGEADEQMHERELECHRYDHDGGAWVDDEIIPLRVIHDDFLPTEDEAVAQPVQEPVDLAEITAYIVKIARWAGGKIEVERKRGAGYFHAEVDALVALRPYTLYWLKAHDLGGDIPNKAPKIPDTPFVQPVQPVQPAPVAEKELSALLHEIDSQCGNGMMPWAIEDAYAAYEAAVRTGGAG